MPKPTFKNLPEDKREKIEQAAIAEFTAYSFDQASINRIVDTAEIPKGSFYQYFNDKKDLYKHVLDLIVMKKMDYMSPVMANPMSVDFFILLREIYLSGLRFAVDNPDLQQIGRRLLADRNHPVFVEFMQENLNKSDELFHVLISKGIERGELRADLDIKFTAHIISSLNTAAADYYQQNIKVEIDEEYMLTVDKFIDFLRNGIGRVTDEQEDRRL
ncbi:MAG: hypothetical protein PWP10_2880 [Clostridiales bacterium]|jgi:AcrR family transcriptional regulator|nr:hypothetical protein [Clostridiales bacterium]